MSTCKEINLNEWVKKFDNFEFSDPHTSTQCEAGWYDWFCNDYALAAKTKKLGKKLKQIMKSDKVNCETSYVFFKNNCPCFGSLYDDFRICSIEDEEVIYTISPSLGYTDQKGVAEVWGRENEFKDALVSGTWADVKEFFNV